MAEIGKNTDLAADLLQRGKLVAIPTETVYGLAANALDEKAVLSIFETKQRPFFDPLILHVGDIDSIKRFAELKDERLKKLTEVFWPGPLTLLLDKKDNVPALVTAGLAKVAIRIPNHVLTLELLQKVDFPLAAPSANPFGYISPTQAGHVNKQLGSKVEYILDGGNCSVGLESTIIGIEANKPTVYRLGGLSVDEIERIIGPIELQINNSSNPKAPGQLKSHYAPKKPLFVGDIKELLELNYNKKIAIICFGNENFNHENYIVFNLSKTKNLSEAAINLFKLMRLADESNTDIVVCELLPNLGIGCAINDRLTRASVQ